jgi:hypothetical protein
VITANVLHRVFRIQYGSATGTPFAIDHGGKQYLVTAKHVVAGLGDTGTIDIYSRRTWRPHSVKLVGHGRAEIDVSVVAADRGLTPEKVPLEPNMDGLVYGQDVHFLGFPYGILTRYILGGDGYPIPLVKKATVSALDRDVLLLDGHNNPGFSGGPVVFVRPGTRDCRIAAIVSSYQAVEEPILLHGQETELVYEYNTGIIVAYSIKHAIDLIAENPVGFLLGTA